MSGVFVWQYMYMCLVSFDGSIFLTFMSLPEWAYLCELLSMAKLIVCLRSDMYMYYKLYDH